MKFQSSDVEELLYRMDDADSHLTLRRNGQCVHISLNGADFDPSSTVKNQYLHFLNVVHEGDTEDTTTDDFYDWVLDACAAEFDGIPSMSLPPEPTLKEFFSIKDICYRMLIKDDKLTPVLRTDGRGGMRPWGTDLDNELCSHWPTVRPQDVKICAATPEAALAKCPKKVTIDGKKIFYLKSVRSGCQDKSIEHLLRKYQRIKESGLQDLRISHLVGLARDEAGLVFGLLFSYIDSPGGEPFSHLEYTDTPVHLRQRWERQITETLDRLHAAGVVWGDAAPRNDLLDQENNAWLIGFGNGWTAGWVDEKILGTMEGDRAGLVKTLKHLNEIRDNAHPRDLESRI